MSERSPNVVFLFADDQRFDTIRALGCEAIHTPALDGLVRRGTCFTRAHIPCGTSPAVCMPSRAMLLTGRTLFHIHGAGAEIPPEHTTLGEALRAAGYRTFGTGKWHNGRASYHRGFTDGDEIFFGGMADHWNVPAFHFDPSGRYDATCPIVDEPQRSNCVRLRRCDHVTAGKHSSELVADAAIRFIQGYEGDAPFFAYVSFLAPHDPRTMPGEFLAMYEPEDMQLPPNFMASHPFDNGELRVRDELLAGFPRTENEIRRHLAEYYAMITHLDAQIGRVLDSLQARGILDETIIVFAGDNGLALGQHGLMGKQSCYDHSVRVPLVFAGPGIPQGCRNDALVYLLDVFPTIQDLLGLDAPPSVEGVSLLPAMVDPGASPVRECLYFAYTDKHRAARDDRFKILEYVVSGRHAMTQLFDLEADPWEMHNLADDPAHALDLARMREELMRLRDQWDDLASPWGRTYWSGYGERG